MDTSHLAKLPIIDCHAHFGGPDLDAIDAMLAKEEQAGVAQISVPASSFPGRVNSNPEGFYAKARHPAQVYLFAGLDYSAIVNDVDHRWTLSLAQQVDRLAAMGCDGIKMLNGKPNYRKASGLALDCIIYDDYFTRVEERGFPLLWHVNDPEEFWDPERAPAWASQPGWLYDETFPTKESIYQECARVLEKHPRLNVIFPHFYFLSDDLPRAAAMLDGYPNVSFDLAPGIEMFHNFTKRPAEAREFFLRYQDRIIFGTDFGPDGRLSRILAVRSFLETDAEFHVPTDQPLFWPDHRTMLRGIALPQEALRKIYAENFRRRVGRAPRPLEHSLVMAELHRLAALQDALRLPHNPARRVAQLLSGETAPGGHWMDPYLDQAL